MVVSRLHRCLILVSVLTLAVLVVLSPVTTASDLPYSIGFGGGPVSLSGSDFFGYGSEPTFGVTLGHRLSGRWRLELDYAAFTLGNDTLATRTDSIGSLYDNSPVDFGATRLGLLFNRKLLAPERTINITTGLGGGLLIWKATHPDSSTAYVVLGEKGERTDFAASELFLSGSVGFVVQPSPRWSLQLLGRADYLTGAGAEFETDLHERLDKILLGAQVKLNIHFGSSGHRQAWNSNDSWTRTGRGNGKTVQAHRDSDGDGVVDAYDECLNTPVGAKVDGRGCPFDSDRDGVPNGVDDCPNTEEYARRMVDIHGCAVDSDFDGIADYLDSCAFNAVGAIVDDNGCPLDSDNDGVADGLDDCPHTLVGVEVDKHGCIELSMLSQPMVLNIDYASGSFEVDPHNRKRIERLAGLLNFVSDIKLDISGYTDNIGSPTANRSLSEKRANRVKGILVSLGIEADRIKVFGRGESNFVASNQTAEGRARNRRIEIVFYR